MEGLRMGVAGKAQQSCGFGGKPAPGVGELHCHVKLTLEGRGSWSMTPVLTSSPLKQKVPALLLSHTQSTIGYLVQCLFAAVFVTSTSLTLRIAFLATFITNFILSSLCSHFPSSSLSLPLPSPHFIL